MKIGLYFGTFNPIHIGHLIIANHFAEYSDLDKVWMVLTPHNPFKKKSSLLDNNHRYQLLLEALEDYPKIEPSTIEFNLPQPNYTTNTLAHLKEKYPQYEFSLIMGEDNLRTLHKWKNYEVILENHQIYVYPRISEITSTNSLKDHKNIKVIDAPVVEISSTFIRKAIQEGKNCRPLLSNPVWDYIDKMNFYR
ncbi:nicotinate (nicotinamide) nucleotide adenylyltransferase [Leeuwenhoekiella aequorea]|uniref:Probable nicotinate-nucleotide adenylyltransferase n=2 Tax=Flavobacteriia TaxID=117743 RepID=A0A4Q0P7P8_9FLAO|nr:nicotinate (nicotinamide) nucleotide adenylyltransferase [Leeuwenhoekiella aequorea]AOE06821.1 nicotinate-nucleotide adenylyltransferase [uncultured bacterium]RXG22166.1 nicotinate-nucleotide adenylyltransferase [Leeuwenhoekiella aequorea]CCG00310.1 nicotinate-nucleotide adenylyltransferase [uncultured Flavobacteriia bacterium]